MYVSLDAFSCMVLLNQMSLLCVANKMLSSCLYVDRQNPSNQSFVGFFLMARARAIRLYLYSGVLERSKSEYGLINSYTDSIS